MRVVQMTPPGSACSVVIGEGLPLGAPGTARGAQLVVDDIDAGRTKLARHGVPTATWCSSDPKVLLARASRSSTIPTGTAGPCRRSGAADRAVLIVVARPAVRPR
jgi:hypothetical protein